MRSRASCSLTWCLSSLGGLMGAGINTVLGLASAAGGAFLWDKLGFAGYVLLDAIKVGSLGGAMVGGTGGIVLGALITRGVFQRPQDFHEKFTCGRVLPAVVILQAVNGAVGYLIYVMLFNGGSSSNSWTSFGKTEAYMATGGVAAAGLFMLCCTGLVTGMVVCLWRCVGGGGVVPGVEDDEEEERRVIINAGMDDKQQPYFQLDIRRGRGAAGAPAIGRPGAGVVPAIAPPPPHR